MKEKPKNKFIEKLKSEQKAEVKGATKKSHIPFRLNFLFFVVFGLFVALLVQLAYLQIAHGSFFEAKIEWSQKTVVQGNAPRGMIYDAKGEVLVGNEANQAIIYTKRETMQTPEMRTVSEKIVNLIAIEADKLSERDKKDYWLADAANLKAAQGRLKDKEKATSLSNAEVYSNTVDKVTEEEIVFDQETLKAATVFKRINGAYAMTPVFIKNKNVTKEEVAIIGENITEIPGISTGMDWDREYPREDFMRSILGTVSSEKTGLPEEESAAYLAKGYARNDRVGLSYLEKQYESVLKGTKSQSEVIINKETNEIESNKEVYEGEKGKNLVLTIDMEFQKKVTEILEKNYQIIEGKGKTAYSEGIYAVVNHPKTGEINAMVGLARDEDTGELKDDTLGTINNVFTPGSVIKGATIMSGYENGIISGNDSLVDEVIQLKGDNPKKSVFTSGPQSLTAIDALRRSSNVYMMKIVMGMMGETYTPNMTLGDHSNVFQTLRNSYESFGLGTATGIDLPGESNGLVPKIHYTDEGNLIEGRMGNLLDLSYGNFDAYTTMQVAQYISTIANDGIKVAPHVVKGVYGNSADGGLGELEQNITPKIMSSVGTQDQLEIIQEGMYQVINHYGGTAQFYEMPSTKYVAAGKTGTAEVPKNNPNDPENPINLVNSTMVAYAPYDDPKVAVTVILPHLKDEEDNLNTKITAEILNAYYDFYEKD
ncbi:peptidoglycan D,D-transpeptidase FtsI family protein [Vagococcus salmoninarum]|uniref:peptidoglycan D,D-transpeptidase FtsI family protein n=2 Tax=Vagococcus salmoninarum TaxID=2739 RepID=UPI00187ED65B|nr:penicillin-binding protein 2 [Vagococcus salmoninarum]MBE9390308.1 penicillin-binding protein 2 [Vagococcus salmoninarum]